MAASAKKRPKGSTVRLPLERRRWTAVCLGTVVVILLLPAALRALGFRSFVWELLVEDSFYEVAGALCALFAAIVFFATYLSGRTGNDFVWFKTPRNVFHAVLGILMLFLFGEEISWGQRLFGYATPDWMSELNTQGEFTLHNLSFFEPDAITNYLSVLVLLALIPYFGLFPIVCRGSEGIRNFVLRLGLPVPSVILAATFWLGLAGQASIFFAFSDGEFFVQELNDVVTEVVFLLFALEMYARDALDVKPAAWKKASLAAAGVLLVVLPVSALVGFRNSGSPIEPVIAEYLYIKGVNTLNASLADEAIALFEESLDVVPQQKDATCALGRAYHLKGDFDRAVDRYNAALEIDPDFPLAYYYRGLISYERGEFNRALADFNQALRTNPDFQPAKEAIEMTNRQKRANAPGTGDQ